MLGGAVGLLAAGLILRGVAPGVLLFPGTALAAAAIALLNVLLPSLVKRRAPERAGAADRDLPAQPERRVRSSPR